jgi:hypothetical protein
MQNRTAVAAVRHIPVLPHGLGMAPAGIHHFPLIPDKLGPIKLLLLYAVRGLYGNDENKITPEAQTHN